MDLYTLHPFATRDSVLTSTYSLAKTGIMRSQLQRSTRMRFYICLKNCSCIINVSVLTASFPDQHIQVLLKCLNKYIRNTNTTSLWRVRSGTRSALRNGKRFRQITKKVSRLLRICIFLGSNYFTVTLLAIL